MNQQVARRVVERRVVSESEDGYVIGSPTDPTYPWDRDNAQKAARKLLNHLADDLDIVKLRSHSTHIWRATLNTLLQGAIPDVQRAALFGHDVSVNRTSYTDVTDVGGMAEAFRTTLKQDDR